MHQCFDAGHIHSSSGHVRLEPVLLRGKSRQYLLQLSSGKSLSGNVIRHQHVTHSGNRTFEQRPIVICSHPCSHFNRLNPSAIPGRLQTFCAGGDIRFFHQAALAGDACLDDFFTEEYALIHLIHRYPKLFIALADGIVMGGGMGLVQGAQIKVVSEQSKLAMPETLIGFFPDVGGGYFLSRCPGSLGEYLGVTGHVLSGQDAVAVGLAHTLVVHADHSRFLEALMAASDEGDARRVIADFSHPHNEQAVCSFSTEVIDRHFRHATLSDVIVSLEADGGEFATATLRTMRQRSPIMMAVTLRQIREARKMDVADCLRMERTLARNCFSLRRGAASETVEGIRALIVDKGSAPRWQPSHVDEIDATAIDQVFGSAWPPHAHPLRHLDREALVRP